MRVVDPGDRVRFTRDGDRLVKDQRAFFLGVHALKRHGPGGEMAENFARGRDHNHVVVFLQGHHDLAFAIDRDELGLGVFGGDIGQAGDVHGHGAVAIQAIGGGLRDGHETGGHLAHAAFAQILVALVLDRHGDKAAIGAHGDAVGLAAQITGRQHFLAVDVDGVQGTGDVDEILRQVLTGIGGLAVTRRRRSAHLRARSRPQAQVRSRR